MTREEMGADQRPLNASQLAMCAAEKAILRQGEHKTNRKKKWGPDAQNGESERITQAEAADKLNVSPRSVQTVRKVLEESPALAKKVKAGEMRLNKALNAIKHWCEQCKRIGEPLCKTCKKLANPASE